MKLNKKILREMVGQQLTEGFSKKHFLNLIKQDLESKKGQLAYAEDKIRYSGTPKWERKEWLNVAKDLKKEIKVLKVRVKQVSKMEEGKLNEKPFGKLEFYQGYSSKEAKKVIDDELKKWAKDLRQVQYRVVKTWMSLAKKGVIDYFDLVRGLDTGDISRAKPYETKFLKGLLDRDKILDRFRSYFGGKKGKRGRRK